MTEMNLSGNICLMLLLLLSMLMGRYSIQYFCYFSFIYSTPASAWLHLLYIFIFIFVFIFMYKEFHRS